MQPVVVGVTNVESAEDAAAHAADLARALGAPLHLVSAVSNQSGTMGPSWENWTFDGTAGAETHTRAVMERLGHGLETSMAIVEGDPARALCAEAERLDASMIVVGSARTRGLGRILGSVANDVIRQAPCAVHVAKTV